MDNVTPDSDPVHKTLFSIIYLRDTIDTEKYKKYEILLQFHSAFDFYIKLGVGNVV